MLHGADQSTMCYLVFLENALKSFGVMEAEVEYRHIIDTE
jgi:hypothetical protein